MCRDYMVRRSSEKDPGKLAGVWCGPWTVTSTWGNVVCTIKRVGGDEVRRAHVDQMKPFKCATVTPRQSRRDRQPPPPSAEEQQRILRKMRRQSVSDAQSQGSDDDGNDGDYEVDSVIGHLRTSNGFWFLLKFKGYEEPTWEHESVVQAPKLVQAYFKRVCSTQL